ncbi:hypothetical protein [Thermococcus henrietii]|uniref:hypothetical protein n=1 Tax=Thermococcus henrietii TaxID=2016361 RepID=UPI000C075136|nr:hypothetical protein [Thermococcus henrietii]
MILVVSVVGRDKKVGVSEARLIRSQEDWGRYSYRVYAYVGKIHPDLTARLNKKVSEELEVKLRILKGRKKLVEVPFTATLLRVVMLGVNKEGRSIHKGTRFQFTIPQRVVTPLEDVLGWERNSWPVQLFFEHDERFGSDFLVCELKL